ncbi:hypothetical protein [Methylobacterium sp. J-076]|uniref:hypothetical protein n=1 Tax=Methylobacterium sp. J-076 TaxID=2836655 RepID=UPI001FB9F5FE|nr:hypothetical protein [Methylobacterium sp. J-076]MCJ2015222.1 hypothetical protein [Methylobacterium sp. J-076]
MADRLGDYARGQVRVECVSCRRVGCYDVRNLHARFGLEIEVLDLLRALSASCRHQQPPGAPKPRKYVAVCQARITMPRQPTTSLPTPGGMPYTIETWNIEGGGVEMHLAELYRLDMAEAAFEVVCALWPTTEATIRQRARIVRRRERKR